MELFTRSYDREWNRIVDLIVFNDKGISKYINDDTTYKFVLLDKGELTIEKEGVNTQAKAPAFFVLSEKDKVKIQCGKTAKTTAMFFKPSVIREEFTYEYVDKVDFDGLRGSTVYQDLMLIYGFTTKNECCRKTELQSTVYYKMKGLVDSIQRELTLQKDGFWPCRSRSYLMELLYYLCYNFVGEETEMDAKSQTDIEFGMISDYLHQHINEDVTLERITKDLSINRNRLNEIFHEKTSMTCLNCLTKMRMELASILLAETDLRISEICERIGYDDSNYFTKAFKKEMGMTPSAYRKNIRQ